MAGEEWRETTVGVLCDEGVLRTQTGPFGSQLHSYDYVSSGVPVVPTEGIGRRRLLTEGIPEVAEETAHRLSRHRLKSGDILFARRGVQATGLSAIVTPKQEGWICGTGAILLRVLGDSIQPEFLSFLLSSDESIQWLKQHAVGAVMPNLNEGVIRQLPLTLPPFAEQKAIAAVLGALDDKIELNRRMNATLEAIARALFQSWFVDFDPVRAKLDGRHPPGLDAASAALFPDSFVESALGQIPKGWAVDSIKSRASNIQYGFTQSASKEAIGPHFLRITDIRGGMIDWASVPFCEATQEEQEKYRIQDGDIFIARTGASTGDNIYVVDPPFAVFASYLVRIQFASCGLARLVGEFTRTTDYSNHVAGTIGGSAQPNASAQTLAAASLVFPTEDVAEAFYRNVRPLDLRRAANDQESRTLATLRDILLPKLLSGDLRPSVP